MGLETFVEQEENDLNIQKVDNENQDVTKTSHIVEAEDIISNNTTVCDDAVVNIVVEDQSLSNELEYMARLATTNEALLRLLITLSSSPQILPQTSPDETVS